MGFWMVHNLCVAVSAVLLGAGMARVGSGPPLPLPVAPRGGAGIGVGVDLVEGVDGGVVFLWGMAAWCWAAGDEAGRRLAAVQAVETRAAQHREVAPAFGVDEVTLRRWRQSWTEGGVEALVPRKRGPKGPSMMTPEKRAEVVRLRAAGWSRDAIVVELGVGAGSVSRALAAEPAPVSPGPDGGVLEPLARPEARSEERAAAARGELTEAEPQICEGASLPLAGALVILPALAATGLLDAVAGVFRPARAAFYGLRSLVLTVVFAALVGEPRAEGLTRLNPVDLGRLLGLDRAPEVRCLRARMTKLARQGRSEALLGALARRHIAANAEPPAPSTSTVTSVPTTAALMSRRPMWPGCACRCPLSLTRGPVMPEAVVCWSGMPRPARRWSVSYAGSRLRSGPWSAPTPDPRSSSTGAVGARRCSPN